MQIRRFISDFGSHQFFRWINANGREWVYQEFHYLNINENFAKRGCALISLGLIGIPIILIGLMDILVSIARIWKTGATLQYRLLALDPRLPPIPGWVGLIVILMLAGAAAGLVFSWILQAAFQLRTPIWFRHYFAGMLFHPFIGIKRGLFFGLVSGTILSLTIAEYHLFAACSFASILWLLIMFLSWQTEFYIYHSRLWVKLLFLMSLLPAGIAAGWLLSQYFPFFLFIA